MKTHILITRILMIALALLIFPSLITSQDNNDPSAGPEKGELIFTFISSAYYMDKPWGQGFPIDGIKRTAEIAHKHGVPVTWLVNARSAEEGKELFTEYHEKFGDAVGHITTVNKPERDRWGSEAFYLKQLSYKKLGQWISSEHNSIKESLPWAELIIGGGGHRSDKMVHILEKLGYEGLWGHCWEQTYTDDISDRGTPWGFYFADSDIYKKPATEPGGLVAIEWTARDLNLAFRTGKPEVYSTDPNDVERAGIVEHRNIEYWKRFIDQYARNTEYNLVVPIAVHQEAHEMECTDRVCANDDETIESTAQMLDELFAYVKSIGARIVNANDAIRIYKEANEATPPTFALFDDVLLNEYEEVLVYYDMDGQLFFERGRMTPLLIRNYLDTGQTETSEFAAVPEMPKAECEETAPGKYTCTINSPARLPYGLALWGDWKHAYASGPGFITTQRLSDQLVYFSFVIEKGINTVNVTGM